MLEEIEDEILLHLGLVAHAADSREIVNNRDIQPVCGDTAVNIRLGSIGKYDVGVITGEKLAVMYQQFAIFKNVGTPAVDRGVVSLFVSIATSFLPILNPL